MKITYKLISNDLASKHSGLIVDVKVRYTGGTLEKSVSSLINEAEKFDGWHEIEPEHRTIEKLDDFLCDYVIDWSSAQ